VGLSKGEAFVFRTRPFAESDLIVTLFTERWGKRTLIAKRARRFDSPLGGAFDLLNRVEVVFYPRARMDLASQASLLEGYTELKRDLEGTSTALAVARALDRLLAPHQEEKETYGLFRRFLDLLERKEAPIDRVKLAATLKVLALSGHRPQLVACVACGKRSGSVSFSCERGGLLCEGCARGGEFAVSRGLALSLDSLLHLPLERSGVVALSVEDAVLAGEVLSSYVARCASGS
jgi:DNA repair protein RecO (recombination protein O)